MATLDNMHIDYTVIDGYDRDNNIIIAPRHDGKTTCFMVRKAYKAWVADGTMTCVVFRNTADMTDFALQSYIEPINKFKGTDYHISFSSTERDKGVCICEIDKKPFLLAVSLSSPERRLKGLVCPKCRLLMFDEVIINARKGEKYLKDEFNKMKTLLDTLRKEGRVRAYLLGNPYSLVSPYSSGFRIDLSKARINTMLTGESWAFWYKDISPELRAWLLEHDATYKEKDEYTRWALDGVAVNDENENVGPMRGNYRLDFAVVYSGRTIGIFRNMDPESDEPSFYVREYADNSKRRYLYTFELDDMINNTLLAGKDERRRFSFFKRAIRAGDVRSSDISVAQAVREIFPYL